MVEQHYEEHPPRASLVVCGLVLSINPSHLPAQNTARDGDDSSLLLSAFEWRGVGPMRGGRVFGVAGHASQPDTFYFGSVGGGVRKTENAGRTWSPISDRGIPNGSIGAMAVAPSDANIVYVGTGESDIRSQNSYGIGMFKSTEAGKTWTHIGLEHTRHRARCNRSA